jgi:hypothetical protein
MVVAHLRWPLSDARGGGDLTPDHHSARLPLERQLAVNTHRELVRDRGNEEGN